MRARTAEQLTDPARIERIKVSPYNQPRILREAIRDLLQQTGVATLRDILLDPDTPAPDRLRALDIAYRYGIGSQTGLVDGDGNSLPGVIALPALQMEAVQADKAPLRLLPGGSQDEIGTERGHDVPSGSDTASGNEAGGPGAGPGENETGTHAGEG